MTTLENDGESLGYDILAFDLTPTFAFVHSLSTTTKNSIHAPVSVAALWHHISQAQGWGSPYPQGTIPEQNLYVHELMWLYVWQAREVPQVCCRRDDFLQWLQLTQVLRLIRLISVLTLVFITGETFLFNK